MKKLLKVMAALAILCLAGALLIGGALNAPRRTEVARAQEPAALENARGSDSAGVQSMKASGEDEQGTGQSGSDDPGSEDPAPVPAKAEIKLSKSSFVYNGKVQKPEVTVTADGEPAEADVVFDKGCRNAGLYHVTAELTGAYTGTATASFRIVPKGTTIEKLTPKVKGFAVKIAAQTEQTTGYQICYARNKSFARNAKRAVIGKNTKVTRTVTNLGQRKRYYVKVRTFAKVDGVRLYSAWSKAKRVRTKAVVEPPELKFADWASGSLVSVRWTYVPGVDGYKVYRSHEENGAFRRVATNSGSKELRAVVKEERANEGYYRIRAFRTVDGKRRYSPYSNTVKCVTYKKSNLGYLFPSGPPASESEMLTYLVSVRLKVRTSGGGTGHITLPIHRKLADRVKAAFDDMYDIGFKVRSGDTGSYNWRQMRTVNLMSHHSYGCVVDLNWQANPMVSFDQIGHSAYNPSKNSYCISQEVVQIWKDHGFYWGGDWTEKKDYMHLTFTNN